MFKANKPLSIILSLAIVASCLLVGGVVSQASGLDLYQTVNTYDDENVNFINTSISGNPGTYVNSETDNNNFAVYNTQIEKFDDTQNNAARFTKATHPSDEKWRALVRIYEQGSENLKQFKPKPETTYELKLKYLAAAKPSHEVKIQVVEASYQQISYQNSDYANDRILADVFTVSEQTDGWVEATVKFTTPTSPKYLCLGTCSSTGNWVSNVDIWVDDIVLSECGTVNVHNYDGSKTSQVDVTVNTTVSELGVPEVEGMLFDGAYADAEFSQPLSDTDKASDHTDIYYRWKNLGYGEYYVGFENYSDLKNVISLGENAAIVDGAAFAGVSALEIKLSENKASAFELRDDVSIDIFANHKYKISFKYKANKDIKVSAGVGSSFNVPATAYALTKDLILSACNGWNEAVLEDVTVDRGLVDGFSLALLTSSEYDAEVYFDDIYVTDVTDKTAGAGLSFDFSDDWYPTVNTADIWDGTTKEPADANGDDIYEITNGSELAYIAKNGGEGKDYILTNDIYLNDITKINWLTGVADGYTPQSWYSYYGTTHFTGSIDGNYHIVYGLYMEQNPGSYVYGGYGCGLIPVVANGADVTVSNLGVDCAYIHYEGDAAAFVGDLKNNATVSFNGCFVGENVYLRGGNAGAFCGRTGSDATVNISNCYSIANAVSSGYTSGIAGVPRGNNTKIVVKNSYNANGAIFSSYYTSYREATNSYQSVEGTKSNEKVLSLANMQGIDALSNANKMVALNADNVFVAGESFPELKMFVKPDAEVWQGDTVAPLDTDGDGIYEIGRASELAYIIMITGGEGRSYKLTNDIYLNDISKINWVTGAVAKGTNINNWYGSYGFTTFSGNIDGAGHTIYGLYNDQCKSGKYLTYATGSALIPAVSAGADVTIKNLGIDNAFVNYESNASAFVGYLPANSSLAFDKCFVGDKVTLEGGFAGAFNGRADKNTVISVTNSYSLAKMTTHAVEGGTAYNAGFCGYHSGCSTAVTVKNSFNANGPIFSGYYTAPKSAENSYQSADNPPSGVTKLSADNMKGNDVLSSEDKMSTLGTVFKVTERNYADIEYYTYLPEGTVIGGSYQPTFYEHFINSALAPLSSDEVLFGKTMTRGAYVKFGVQPNAQDILVPTSKLDQVVQGSADEVLLNRDYYDIEFDIVSENLASQVSTAVNYIFITDIHYPGDYSAQKSTLIRQMQLICKMANENENIDFVAVGGDIVHGYYADKADHFAAIQEILAPLVGCNKPVIVAAGNHDDNCYGEFATAEKAANVVSNLDWNRYVIDYIVDPTTNNAIVQDEDYNNEKYESKYYYYDLESKKTRVICLDSSNYPHSYDDNGQITLKIRDGYTADSPESVNKYVCAYNYYGYSAAQLQWLASDALTADKGWNYVFISHMGIDEATNASNAVVNYGTELRELIKAYQAKTSYKNTALDIDVDWSSADGKILSYHYGHVHSENAVYSEDIDLWQYSSATAQSANELIYSADEVCFDVVSVTEGHIFKQNIGRGEINRFVLKAKYDAGDVNVDYTTDICDLVAVSNAVNGKDVVLNKNAADVIGDNVLDKLDLEQIRRLIIGALS